MAGDRRSQASQKAGPGRQQATAGGRQGDREPLRSKVPEAIGMMICLTVGRERREERRREKKIEERTEHRREAERTEKKGEERERDGVSE